MNKTVILGTLTKDVELKYIPSEAAIGSFTIANNQDYKTKDGEKVQKTCFVEVVAYGKQAEIVNQYFHKGSRILVEGALEQQTWVDKKDGTNRSKHVIKLEAFHFIDKKSDAGQNKPAEYKAQKPVSPVVEIDEDEIPF